MGLNDIRLTDLSLAELYPHTLVDTGDVAAAVAIPVNVPSPVIPTSAGNAADTASSFNTQAAAKPETVNTPANSAPAAGKPETGKSSTVNTTSGGWKFLGSNNRKVLVVVDYPEAAYLPDEELAFLTRMLTACKLGLGDVAIVNSAHYPQYASADYLRQFQSREVLLFGREPEAFGLPIAFPQFQVQSFAGVTFLSAPPLGTMMTDTALKTSLWLSLKRIFNL